MKKSKLFISLSIGITLCLSLTGCGFKFRSAREVPPQLHTVYLDTPNPYSRLTTRLSRILKSVNIHLAYSRQWSPVTLHIISNQMSDDIPTILYSGNATPYNYTLTTRFELLQSNGRIILPPNTLTLSDSLLHNANQVYTPEASKLIEQQLTYTMATLIYYHLISLDARKALQNALPNERNHAIARKTTRHTSKKT